MRFHVLVMAAVAVLCAPDGWAQGRTSDLVVGKWDGDVPQAGSRVTGWGSPTVGRDGGGKVTKKVRAGIDSGEVYGRTARRGVVTVKDGFAGQVQKTVTVGVTDRQHWKEETKVNRGQATLSGLDTTDGGVQVRKFAQVGNRVGNVGRSGRVSDGMSPGGVARGGQWCDPSRRAQGGTHVEELVARAGSTRC